MGPGLDHPAAFLASLLFRGRGVRKANPLITEIHVMADNPYRELQLFCNDIICRVLEAHHAAQTMALSPPKHSEPATNEVGNQETALERLSKKKKPTPKDLKKIRDLPEKIHALRQEIQAAIHEACPLPAAGEIRRRLE